MQWNPFGTMSRDVGRLIRRCAERMSEDWDGYEERTFAAPNFIALFTQRISCALIRSFYGAVMNAARLNIQDGRTRRFRGMGIDPYLWDEGDAHTFVQAQFD